jgi:hypothetical protein
VLLFTGEINALYSQVAPYQQFGAVGVQNTINMVNPYGVTFSSEHRYSVIKEKLC